MQKINTDILRLRDILASIADIESFGVVDVTQRKELFASAYAIAVIGEAANNISTALQHQHPEVPWAQMIGMRHRIIHGYGKLNVERLREVIVTHLPVLKDQISNVLSQLESMG